MNRIYSAIIAILAVIFVVPAASRSAGRAVTPTQQPPGNRSAEPQCGSAFDYQVLLDRTGFSPGEIDGQFGRNTGLAIKAFQSAHNLPPTGTADCNTWQALRGRDSSDTVVPYVVTDADTAGPFVPDIPDDLMAQAKLQALAYRSPLEELAERFHVKPELLSDMNGRAEPRPGVTLRVPNVPQDIPALENFTQSVTSKTFAVQVTRESSALMLLDPGGRVLFFAPATVGSEHDPLPLGDWKVKGVAWNPKFHYNPNLFWDADPSHAKATIMPGPNNPVGVVWIALNVAHYGIHGTPDPNLIGHSYSHGCVRLTNWDAGRLARVVRPGTVVHFR